MTEITSLLPGAAGDHSGQTPPALLASAFRLAGVGLCRVSGIHEPVSLDPVASGMIEIADGARPRALLRQADPESRSKLITAVRRALAGEPGRLDMSWLLGDTLAHTDVGVTLSDDDGVPVLLFTLADRTAEREEMAQLRRRNKHLWQTVDLNPQLPWLAEQDKGVIAVTDRYLKLVGLKEEEALGFLGWMKVVHPDDLEKMQAAVGRAMMTNEAMDIRLRFKVANQEYRWMRSQCFPLRNEEGNVVQWYGYTEDIHETVLAEMETRWAADHDSLTALPNRALFNRRLDETIARAAQDMTRVGLMVLDLDHFKDVNDLFGHDAGDKLLVQFSKVLQNSIFVEATIARLGGDEFAILLPNLENPQVMQDTIDAIFAELKTPIKFDGRDFDCRASAGWAIYPTQAANASELFKHADIALYEAKNTGRGRYMAFEPRMKNAMQRRVAMINLGREAVENGRLLPYYQPEYSLETGEIIGFEALLRRRDRNGAICLPGSIYEAFHDFEVAEAIGIEMLNMIVRDMADWRARGIDFGVMSINASTAEFRNRDFIQRLIDHADGAGIPRDRFCVEVNEDVFVGRAAPLVRQMILELKQEGFSIALDDFGTGYASLSHLREIPVDSLKIDRSFIMDLFGEAGSGNDSAAIVSAIIKLGHSLGMTVVAEGIETRRQAVFLKSHGCTIGQGFLFGRPAPKAVVEELLLGARKIA
ncbi:MAG: GGDEF domain-containing protein [Sphingomonas sanxanigenens]|uniref:GGDEF domain-containing protein n=1 Tax=Sphingomonas sanxanigenens TaxID=397260 RepID=A0A2W5A7D8_9SPHN|nr:MAG: GGDEF domain-containing protein [Sphingomonas sanxanigenens]